MTSRNWHSQTGDAVLEAVSADSLNGLTSQEAERRRAQFGPNRLPADRPLPRLRILLSQFESPLIYILAVAGIITLLLKEFDDAIIICGVVVLNVFFGYAQESRATRALRALKQIITVKALVLRDGGEKELEQEEVTVGDIILLKTGMKVPADARLLTVHNLKINESALTGEWLAAEKDTLPLPENTVLADRDNMVYLGTVVEEGRAKAAVVAIGTETEIGKIATSLRTTKEQPTAYQKKLNRFAKIITAIVVVVSLVIFLEGLMTGGTFIEMFTTAVAISVAAIPEGLPIAMTVILATGMHRILKRKGLVRKLASAETLGSTSIICTDKTGTLTEGRMEVAGIFTGAKELALKICTLCNDAFIENLEAPMEEWRARGNPTDKALLLAGLQAGLAKNELLAQEPFLDDLPFDPVSKYYATLHRYSEAENTIYAVGAPEKLLSLSAFSEEDGSQIPLTPEKRVELQKKQDELAAKGLRLVAAVYKRIAAAKLSPDIKEKNLEGAVFVGFVALHDPIRKEVKESLRLCRLAGMKPIIITGDHRLTAKAAALALGLDVTNEQIMEGSELEKLSDAEFATKLDKIQIYARTEPSQKLRIVEAWQKRGEVVAMTGDGVNDAPALKQADIGVAVGSGTDVAKETADLVLLDNSFSTIVAAIEEGRAILDNIRKVITYLLSNGFTEVILVGVTVFAGLPLPVIAVQILWVNLIADTMPSIALALEPKDKDVMARKPGGQKTPLLTREMKIIIFIIGLITDLILLGIFLWLWRQNYSLDYVRTMVFAMLTISTLFIAFPCKSLRKNLWEINIFDNKILLLSWAAGLATLLAALYLPLFNKLLHTIPLPLSAWPLIAGLGIISVILIEATKWLFIRLGKSD